MSILQDPLMGFIVIFIATFLLGGECLVKVRGVFGFIGFLLYVFFLYDQLTHNSPTWLIVILISGVIFILLDGLLIGNGSVAFIGLLFIMLSLAVSSPSVPYGIGVCVAFWVGLLLSLFLLKKFPARSFWRRLTLVDQSTSERGYNSLSEKRKELLGKKGKTVSILRPVGTIEIDGDRYSAETNGEWLEAGAPVVVSIIDGTKIVVKAEKIDLEKNETFN